MQPNDPMPAAGAILPPGDTDEPLEAWQPDDFDHFTDLGLEPALDDD